MNSLLMVLIAIVPMVCQADSMERMLKATLADATSQSQAGQHDAAVALARTALESATTRYGPEDEHVGAVLTVLSVVLENAGYAREALTTMESAVAILDKPKLSSDIEKAFIRLRLATLYLDASRGAEAVRLYQQAMPFVEKHTSTNDPLRALIWARLAAANYEAHALPELNSALGHARNLLDNPKLKRDMQTLLAIKITADTYGQVEQYDDAAKMYARGLELLDSLRAKVPALKLAFLQGRGAALVRLYRFSEADQILADAVKLSQETSGQSQLTTAGLRMTLGESLYLQGRYAEAIAETLEGLKALESAGALGTNGTIAAYSILTLSYSEAGRYAEAVDAGLKAKKICAQYCNVNDRRAETIAMNLGGAYFQLAQYDEALPLIEQALKSLEFQNVPPSRQIALAKNNLAITYLWLGQAERAEKLERDALSIMTKVEPADSPYLGSLHDQYSLILLSLGQFEAAIASGRKAVEILEARKSDNLALLSRTLNNLGRAYYESNDYHAAADAYERAIQLQTQALGPNHPSIGKSLSNLATAQASLGKFTQALGTLKRALAMQAEILGMQHPDTASTLSNLAVLLDHEGDSDAGIAIAKTSVNSYQAERARLRPLGEENIRSYTRKVEEIYRFLAGALVDKGRLTEAQTVLDLLKETEAYEFLQRSSVRVNLKGDVEFDEPEKQWTDRYQEASKRLAEAGIAMRHFTEKSKALSDEERRTLDRLQSELNTARNDFSRLIDDAATIGAKSTRRPQQATPKAADIATKKSQEILATFPAGTVLLQYFMSNGKLRILLTTNKEQMARTVSLDSKVLRRQVAQLRSEISHPDTAISDVAEQLYEELLAPVAVDLVKINARTLMIGLDGVLRYIPFGALRSNGRYLVEKWNVVLYTSVERDRLRRPRAKLTRLLGLGVTKASGDLAALPSVRDEINQIVATGKAQKIASESHLDGDFTAERLRNANAAGFQMVHVASHFRFSPGTEEKSYLLLGNDQRLSLGEVRRRNYRFDQVDLLTLSACDTALGYGDGSLGEEIEGFGVVAQAQGAQAVLATLWQVNDRSTSAFMRSMYRARFALGSDKASAMRTAQLELLHSKDYSHPYFWAPFVLIGNWR